MGCPEVLCVSFLIGMLMTYGCRSMYVRETTSERYTIYVNGIIYTVNPKDPDWDKYPEEAMVINQITGKIVFIGTTQKALKYDLENSSVYNLDGSTVLPGFHDVHMHPLEAMTSLGGGCKIPGDTDPEHLLGQIAECNPNDGGNSWVLGHGHSIESLLKHIHNRGRPPREIIDEVIPDNPVVLMEETSHSVWVNSLALDLAHISKDSDDPVGGIIMRDSETLMPNGILLENAGNMMMDVAMASFTNLNQSNYESLKASLIELKKNGITSICDARTYWKRSHHLAWKKACINEELTVRVNLGLWAYPNMEDSEQIRSLKELYTNDFSRRCFLKINEIKLYSDGLLETTTAAMLEPYLKNLRLPGLQENIGMNYFSQSRVEKYLKALQSFGADKGFNFHIHAIGDRGIKEILNAISNTQTDGTRHRLTHLHIVSEHDIPRFSSLGVVADFQVTNTHIPAVEEAVGLKRAENYIPVRSIEKTGAKTTLSSDWDVSRLNPLEAIQEAATRDRQAVSVKSAIEMKTVNSAYAMRQDDIVGYLGNNMDADFVILSRDILSIDTNNIGKTEVLLTAIQGKVIYQKFNDYPSKE